MKIRPIFYDVQYMQPVKYDIQISFVLPSYHVIPLFHIYMTNSHTSFTLILINFKRCLRHLIIGCIIFISLCLFVCICDLQIGHLKKGINPLSVSELAFGSPHLSSAIKTGIITGIIGLAVSIQKYNSLHMHQMLIAWHLAPLLINDILISIICALLTCTGWNFELMHHYFKTNSGYIHNYSALDPT